MSPGHIYIKTRKKKVKTGRLLFLLVLLAFVCTVLFSVRFIGMLNALQDSSTWASSLPQPVEGKREHLLLYTVSDRESEGYVTELVLVAYHPQKKEARAIHLPADTLVDLEDNGFVRLGHIYSAGGRELLVDTVSRLFDGLPIHYYLEIDEDFLPSAVDKVGGIELSPGLVAGNGGDVLSLIHAEGLTLSQRLERRRSVLSAVSAKIVQGNILQKLKYLHSASPLIATNLPWRKLLFTMEGHKNTSFKDTVHVILLPGTEQVKADGRYWLADANQLPLLAAWLDDDVTGVPRSQVTVEVLNGCGARGIASEVAEMLRSEGFQVLRVGNADHYNYEVSQVISRVSNVDGAKEVAVLIPGSQLLKEEALEAGVMVTLIIGKNYLAE